MNDNDTTAITDFPALQSTLKLIVADYLDAARTHRPFHSAHEGYAVILEEMDELKAEVWKRQQDPQVMVTEAIHVAAMALRFIVDLFQVTEQPASLDPTACVAQDPRSAPHGAVPQAGATINQPQHLVPRPVPASAQADRLPSPQPPERTSP